MCCLRSSRKITCHEAYKKKKKTTTLKMYFKFLPNVLQSVVCIQQYCASQAYACV